MKKKSVLILVTIYHAFQTYRIQLLSATLAYYTLIAIVPVLALFISLAENLHVSSFVESTILDIFEEQKEIASYLIKFAKNAVEIANHAYFKIIGLLLLFWASIKIVHYIDVGINQLWGNPPEPKFLKKRLRFFLILITIFVLFFLASTWSFFLTLTFNYFLKQELLSNVAKWLIYASNILPSFVFIIILTFLYFYVPYVKIRLSSALISATITSVAYQVFQWLYFSLQIFISNYNKIYGTFAAFPLFLVWLQMSWLIFFVGIKLCYSLETYE